jgi:hypothetical protein
MNDPPTESVSIDTGPCSLAPDSKVATVGSGLRDYPRARVRDVMTMSGQPGQQSFSDGRVHQFVTLVSLQLRRLHLDTANADNNIARKTFLITTMLIWSRILCGSDRASEPDRIAMMQEVTYRIVY